jgi:DNA-binding HxlR family transcriptional regulator
MNRGFGQFCPVALASEVLTQRWSLLIVRELLAGATRFNEIRRGVPRLSPTLLKERLNALERAEVLERHRLARGHGCEYRLTSAGVALRPVVTAVGEWGQRWARDIRPQDLDPGWLVWGMHRRLNTDVMPPGRIVIELEFSDVAAGQRRFWLVHHGGGEVEVCVKDPGYEVTVRVLTRVRTMAEVWRGIVPLRTVLTRNAMHLSGAPGHCRAFPSWLKLSVYAPIRRARRHRA